MSSVEQDRAGTASGINNAVARVSGVLAVAVLGLVMILAFGHNLRDSLDRLDLPASALRDIQSNLVKLGSLEPPFNLDASTTATVRADITQAFVFGFRLIMLICAGLAVASAAVALQMIPSRGSGQRRI